MNEIEVTGADGIFYMKMWGALKMGVDPMTFRKQYEEDWDMMAIIEAEMTNRNKRRTQVQREMARVKKR